MNNTVLFLVSIAVVAFSDEIVLQPSQTTGTHTALVLVGRNDTVTSDYVLLAEAIQSAVSPSLTLWVVIRSDLSGIDVSLSNLRSQYAITNVFVSSYSMMDNAGVAIQNYARNNAESIAGVVLIAGFLQRRQRPDIQTCMNKESIKPKRSLKCPLGCLADGSHDCYGPNTPSYPVPTLTIGGELDGVVRVTRLAEAYYTQLTNDDLPVVVIEGMNHQILLNSSNALPPSIKNRDFPSECTQAACLKSVSEVVALFLTKHTVSTAHTVAHIVAVDSYTAAFFAPLISSFKLEGSWWFTGGDDEHGASPWAAGAQQALVLPLPSTYNWQVTNQFHLLSDEDIIPPYFRPQHRADATVTQTGTSNRTIVSSTIAQLRYLEESVTDTAVGLNGYAIIKEEKVHILNAFPDDGVKEVSAIEIATKMRSRQYLFNITGNPSPDSLDNGEQCQKINQQAYDWALNASSPVARARFAKYGTPLVMLADIKPTVPGGPWFIWSYLKYTPQKGKQVDVAAYYTFFSLSASSYGAGTHYCKLLSPARAMEWIYVDGFRTSI